MSASISSSRGVTARMIGFTQIAGLVARRIVGFVKAGDMVAAGQRVGLIRFGSRVDVFLPDDMRAAGRARPARRSRARRCSARVGGVAGRGRHRAMRRIATRRSRAARRVRGPAAARDRAQRGDRAGAVFGPDRRPLRDRGATGNWRSLMVLIAGVLDGVDGRVARLLRGESRFGAELDSLSDAISFGVSPALILYLWSLSALPRFGWICALLLRGVLRAAARAVQRARSMLTSSRTSRPAS